VRREWRDDHTSASSTALRISHSTSASSTALRISHCASRIAHRDDCHRVGQSSHSVGQSSHDVPSQCSMYEQHHQEGCCARPVDSITLRSSGALNCSKAFTAKWQWWRSSSSSAFHAQLTAMHTSRHYLPRLDRALGSGTGHHMLPDLAKHTSNRLLLLAFHHGLFIRSLLQNASCWKE